MVSLLIGVGMPLNIYMQGTPSVATRVTMFQEVIQQLKVCFQGGGEHYLVHHDGEESEGELKTELVLYSTIVWLNLFSWKFSLSCYKIVHPHSFY